MTAEIMFGIYRAVKPDGSIVHFAAVSRISTRPDLTNVEDYGLGELTDISECHGEQPTHKLVKVDLPHCVHDGEYPIGNTTAIGLYSDWSNNDGMGRAVSVRCGKAAIVNTDNGYAIDEAIASGIILSVPAVDNKRHDIRVKVLAISDIYASTAPEF